MGVDILIRGGSVVDGTGAEPFLADVAVSDGKVAWLETRPGSDPVEAGTVIDASGRLVMPGFVDTHSHVDGTFLQPQAQEALLRQGVTTAIIGQDGLGFAPAGPSAQNASADYFGVLNGNLPQALAGGASVADLLQAATHTSPLNIATLVPLGLVWLEVAGHAAQVGDTELKAMVTAVERGLADGAVGLSTGLEYTPNGFAGARELSAVCRPVAAAALPHVTHMRGYELAVTRAFDEVAEVSRRTGVGLHVSHFRGPADLIGAVADRAATDGIALTYDSYPYVRGCTILSMRVLPREIATGQRNDVIARLRTDSVRAQLTRLWSEPARQPELTGMQLAHAGAQSWAWAAGMELGSCATTAGLSLADTMLGLLVDCELQVSVVMAPPETSSESDMRELIRRPEHMTGSDGIYVGTAPHPRGWGTFARLLGRHVRQLGDWSWGQAAVHLSSRPCELFGLRGRGVIRRGAVADLIVVDPLTVRDLATYAEPRRCAVGIDDVLVAGVPVIASGERTANTPGAGLRAGT